MDSVEWVRRSLRLLLFADWSVNSAFFEGSGFGNRAGVIWHFRPTGARCVWSPGTGLQFRIGAYGVKI